MCLSLSILAFYQVNTPGRIHMICGPLGFSGSGHNCNEVSWLGACCNWMCSCYTVENEPKVQSSDKKYIPLQRPIDSFLQYSRIKVWLTLTGRGFCLLRQSKSPSIRLPPVYLSVYLSTTCLSVCLPSVYLSTTSLSVCLPATLILQYKILQKVNSRTMKKNKLLLLFNNIFLN